MPGVLIVEAMAQAGGVLLFTEVEIARASWCVTGLSEPVPPSGGSGDQTGIEVEVRGGAAMRGVWRA